MRSHGFDLAALNRSQLNQVLVDAQRQLEEREAEDRAVLAERCKSLAAELGFDEDTVRVAGTVSRAGRKPRQARTDGGDHE